MIVLLGLGPGVVLPLVRVYDVVAALGATVLGLVGVTARRTCRADCEGRVFVVLVLGALVGSLLDVGGSWFLTWVMAVFVGMIARTDLARSARRRSGRGSTERTSRPQSCSFGSKRISNASH